MHQSSARIGGGGVDTAGVTHSLNESTQLFLRPFSYSKRYNSPATTITPAARMSAPSLLRSIHGPGVIMSTPARPASTA